MALRVNAQAKQQEIDIQRVRNEEAGDGGITHGNLLAGFVDAFMSRDTGRLDEARQALVDGVGAAGMVEAAAVAGNFQRMVRIADSIGIPVDEARIEMTAGIREELKLNDFHTAQNTFDRRRD